MPGLIEKINNKECNVINAKPYTRIIYFTFIGVLQNTMNEIKLHFILYMKHNHSELIAIQHWFPVTCVITFAVMLVHLWRETVSLIKTI